MTQNGISTTQAGQEQYETFYSAHRGRKRKGKNWYVNAGHVKITVNVGSNTIITAHKLTPLCP